MNKIFNKKIIEFIICFIILFLLIASIYSFEILSLNLVIIGIIMIVFIAPRASVSSVICILLIIVFQNFFIIVFSENLSETSSKLIIAFKEIYLYIAVINSLLITSLVKRIIKNHISIVLFASIMLISFVLSGAPIGVKIISIRQIIIPIVTFIFGFSIIISKEKFNIILKFVVFLGIICCVFGIIEMYLLHDKFWIDIGINKYLELKGFNLYVTANELPANMYTYDLGAWTGVRFRRMSSFFADPLLFSHFISLCLLIVMYNKNIIKNNLSKILTYMIFGICILSTFSKGAIIIVFCGILVKVYTKNKYLFYVFATIGIIFSIILIAGGKVDSINKHLHGLISNLNSMSILGDGVGTTGNFAVLYSDIGSDIGAGESMIGTIIGQVGLMGIIVYICFYKELFKNAPNEYKLFIIALLSGILIESFLSESAISFTGSGFYFILVGIVSRNNNFWNKCKYGNLDII